jgi:hypothetical protein
MALRLLALTILLACEPVVRDDPWPRFRVLLLRSLHDDLDLASVIDYRMSQFTMYRLKPSRILHR